MSAEYEIIHRLERGPAASTLDLVTELGLPESEVEAGLSRLGEKGFLEVDEREGRSVYRLARVERGDAEAVLSL
jgi:DNA-binding transcriptional regulator PaaX